MKLVEYGLVGLAIGAVLIVGLQLRPQTVFPSQGTLQVAFTNDSPSSLELSSLSTVGGCHGTCAATSANVTVSSIEVHTLGIDNITGEWASGCTNGISQTFDIVKIRNAPQTVCETQIQPATITDVRLTVSSARARFPGTGIVAFGSPSGTQEIPLSPRADVRAGKTTTILIDFQPFATCRGNGDCDLTPVLHASPEGSD
jgi:hypothetical protein